MFNRQFGLMAIAILLLSPNLVHANELDGNANLSVGNVRIVNTGNGTTIQTPQIQISTPKIPTNPVVVSRTYRRYRAKVVRRSRTTKPLIVNKKVSSSTQITVSNSTTTTVPIPNSTIRSSTIRSSSNGLPAVNEQQQSIYCSNSSGSVVSQSTSTSTSTVNGRTVSSEVHTNCN
jgi:hypothetical protein